MLQRDVDDTGVSGTGVVAAGVEFPDGKVLMRWLVGDHRSSVVWDSIDAVRAIHGHDGHTQVRYFHSYDFGDVAPLAA